MGEARPPSVDGASRIAGLVSAYERRVLAYALRRTITEADAEDAAAETFAIAWRKIDVVPVDALPWLLAVARRVLANQHRSGRRRTWLIEKLARHAGPALEPPAFDAPKDSPAIAALARLRDDDRELLRLVAWEELDQQTIAAMFGITPNAVAIRLHRARRRFRDEFVKGSRPSRTFLRVKGAINGNVQERAE
jgi:RNA polymerase sigma-70 factor, ECF subfamily